MKITNNTKKPLKILVEMKNAGNKEPDVGSYNLMPQASVEIGLADVVGIEEVGK